MREHLMRAASAAALALGLAAGASAPAGAGEPIAAENIIALEDWAYETLYADGWSAEDLIDDGDVISSETGEEIGDVENLLLSPEGELLAVIVEIGGFWDIGDTHVSVPWDEVVFSENRNAVAVPVTEDNVDAYSMFGEAGYSDFVYAEPIGSDPEEEFIGAPEAGDQITVVDDEVVAGPRVWKATELIDDYALLQGAVEYGYVEDLIFSEAGRLKAVVVDPDSTFGPDEGPYAFPWSADDFEPGLPYYELPFAQAEVAVAIEPLDEERLDDEDRAADDVGVFGDETFGEGDSGEK